jgi:HEPN domain-containing protein
MYNVTMDKMVFEQAEQLINRAGARLYVAKDTLAKGSLYYPEVISACIDSIELATKAVALCLGGEYPEAHDFGTKKYEELLGRLRDAWPFEHYPPRRDLARMLNYNSFWATFYTRSKYGFEALRVGAGELFQKSETELALTHAEECNRIAKTVLEWRRQVLQKEVEKK